MVSFVSTIRVACVALTLGCAGVAHASLLGRWSLDNGSMADGSVNSNTLTDVNTAATDDRFYAPQDARALTGSNSYLIAQGDGTALTGPTATIAAWVNPLPGSSGTNYLCARFNSSYGEVFRLALAPTGRIVFGMNGIDALTNNTPIPSNAWSHVAITFNGSNLFLYVNGNLAGAGSPLTGFPGSAGGSFVIGADRTGTNSFSSYLAGAVDDVRVYNHVLTAAELLALGGTRIFHVSTNGNDGSSGTNWATAKRTLQAAVNLAQDGDTVIVSNGYYVTGGRALSLLHFTNRVMVTNAVMLRSVNGPNVTSIVGSEPTFGNDSVRCVYLGTNAMISGFTLTNGWTDDASSRIENLRGGGVYCLPGAVISNCIIRDCISYGHGGGAFAGTYYNCSILNNKGGRGSGVSGDGPGGPNDRAELYDCDISLNYSGLFATPGDGSGVYFAELHRCRVSRNICNQGQGGGAYDALLYNCVVSGNRSSSNGGGAAVSSLFNCTVYSNQADAGSSGSGVYECLTVNSIVFRNRIVSSFGGDVYDSAEFGNTRHCCAPNLPAADGNTTNDPAFVDAAAGDFRLQTNSPCRDAGDVLEGGLEATDYAGRTRLVNGLLDMGAHEAIPLLTVVAGPANGGTATGGGSYPDGTNVQITITPANSHWFFTQWSDGNTNAVRNITVTTSNATYTALMTQVVGSITFYVKTNGNDAADGRSWATARQTIQAGVALTLTGDVVLVSNGVYATGTLPTPGYTTSNRVVISSDITVRSLNGPTVTTIAGARNFSNEALSARCVYMSAGTLSGFTLTNGYAQSVQGANIEQNRSGGGAYADGGTLTNCIITGNSVTNGNGGGVNYGTLNNCIITRNTAYDGGGVNYATLNNCVLSGNQATDYGGGAAGGTLNNCLLVSNTAALVAGAAAGSDLRNCTLTANSAVGVGGVYLGTLNNCIVYYNPDTNGLGNHYSATLNYCCTTPMPGGGSGNITNQPRFLATNNYRLATNSPCVDAGSAAYVSGTADLDGNPRVKFEAVDMGAYEAQVPTSAYWIWANAITNGPSDPTASATGDGYPNLLKYATGSSPTGTDSLARMNGLFKTNNNLFAMQFTRNTNATDVTLVVERTAAPTNNATWTGIATNFHGAGWNSTNVTESGTGSPVTVTIQDVVPATNVILRLRVTRP